MAKEKTVRKKSEELSMWERTEYDIISETETETEKIAVLRTRHSGATVICRIPKHTPEENRKIYEDFVRAAARMTIPEDEIGKYSSFRLIF